MSDLGMMPSRLRARLDQGEGLKGLDEVVEKHSKIDGEPFTFGNHEFQREIIRDTRSRIAVRKCSQVGLSELMVQKVLALSSVLNHKRIIFTLPVSAMAQKFSKDRIDGAINQSDYYSGMVKAANNSASQKLIGSTMLYVGGTFGDTGAISVPAYAVISDEVDFSNQEVLGKLSSRLRAQEQDEMGYPGMRFEFSTPTVDDFGIDHRFQSGDQRYYMVKCRHCNQWSVPDFFQDFVVPGMDKPLVELERRDLRDNVYRFSETWLKCPCCSNELWSSILDNSRRQWVAKFPDRWEHSYQVAPWDVPKFNNPVSIIKQFGEYTNYQDFANFVLGQPFTSPDNTFLTNEDHVHRVNDAELWIFQQHIVRSSTVGGLDVGKTCHLVVMADHGKHSYVVWSEEITNTISSPAAPQVLERFDFFKMRKLVVDAGPDLTLVSTLVNAKGLGAISACQYARTVPGLSVITEHDDGQLIKADRTKTLDNVMRRHNAAEIHYPRRVIDDIFTHLKALKKIRNPNADADGGAVERFEATAEDHYGHALNYANIARMALEEFNGAGVVGAPAVVKKFRFGENAPSKRK